MAAYILNLHLNIFPKFWDMYYLYGESYALSHFSLLLFLFVKRTWLWSYHPVNLSQSHRSCKFWIYLKYCVPDHDYHDNFIESNSIKSIEFCLTLSRMWMRCQANSPSLQELNDVSSKSSEPYKNSQNWRSIDPFMYKNITKSLWIFFLTYHLFLYYWEI